jgi:hypothetical protein
MAVRCISRFEDCLSDTAGFGIRFGETERELRQQFRAPNVAYFTNTSYLRLYYFAKLFYSTGDPPMH